MLYFNDVDHLYQPCDYQQIGLQGAAAYLLGVDLTETRPRIALAETARPIAEPYVCIAVQSTMQAKYWNNPTGWHDIVTVLKDAGYRVICIDQTPVNGEGMVWNHIPHGVEDETGDRSLLERARWIKHAEFFIGLSSGLAWLAWALEKPVVLISGFTHPLNEFATPYRIINYHACNSCFNDVRLPFGHHDFLWCPRHGGTPRQFECTRLITAEHVKSVIRRIPGFGGTHDYSNAAHRRQVSDDAESSVVIPGLDPSQHARCRELIRCMDGAGRLAMMSQTISQMKAR
jgi:autotransporter strand-loop-strand O-heptosyltransferase